MVRDAEKQSGAVWVDGKDSRIIKLARFMRRWHIDEIPQLLNVLKGDMSLVGPRPQVKRDVAIYTKEELQLSDSRPGITDLASIVFSDEGDILAGSEDPDLKYNQVIRPWKSRLGLLYTENHTFLFDLYIIGLTIIAIISRPLALKGVQRILQNMGADTQLLRIARRDEPLQAYPPPGANQIVKSR